MGSTRLLIALLKNCLATIIGMCLRRSWVNACELHDAHTHCICGTTTTYEWWAYHRDNAGATEAEFCDHGWMIETGSGRMRGHGHTGEGSVSRCPSPHTLSTRTRRESDTRHEIEGSDNSSYDNTTHTHARTSTHTRTRTHTHAHGTCTTLCGHETATTSFMPCNPSELVDNHSVWH